MLGPYWKPPCFVGGDVFEVQRPAAGLGGGSLLGRDLPGKLRAQGLDLVGSLALAGGMMPHEREQF